MGYATLIRYALWAALIAAFSFFIWHMAGTIHDNIFEDGRVTERAEWQEREAKRKEQLGRAVSEAAQAMADDREKQVNSLIGAIDNETKAKLELERNLTAERIANRGLWINAKRCGSGNSASGEETENPAIDGGATNRIRLPSQIEQDLQSLAADAQRVVIQYETARRLVASCPQIEIVPDAEYQNSLDK